MWEPGKHFTSEDAQKPKENILVVEDNSDLGEALLMLLASAGYGCRVVCSRDAALLAVQNNIYQAILLDFNMPGLPANVFLNEIKNRSKPPKVILMTCSDAEQVAGLVGVKHFLQKPFAPDRLIHLLRELMLCAEKQSVLKDGPTLMPVPTRRLKIG
jgi:DNA-binding response OmpR family regulator